MPSYETHDPRGWCGDPKRGAALGRPSVHDAEPEGPITVRETLLDAGGYDRNGTYFGQGQALYWYADESGNVDDVFRHSDDLDACFWEENTQAATAVVRERYPNAVIVIAKPIRAKCWGLGLETCDADIADYSGEYCENCDTYANEVCAGCDKPGADVGTLEGGDGDGVGGMCSDCRLIEGELAVLDG